MRKKTKPIKLGDLPKTGYVRLHQVLSVFPVGKSTFWHMIREGRAPEPVRLSTRIVGWRVEDIRALLDEVEKGNMGAPRAGCGCIPGGRGARS